MKFVGIIFEICAGGGFFVMVVLVCDVFFFFIPRYFGNQFSWC